MKFLTRKFTLFVLLLMPMAFVHSEEIVADKVYAAGTQLEMPKFGFGFTVPANWKATLPKGQFVVVLSSSGQLGNIFLTIDKLSEQQVRKSLSEPTPWGDGVMLMPARPISAENNRITMDFNVDGANMAVSAYTEAIIGNFGYSLMALALEQDTAMDNSKQAIRAVSDSVNWKQPQ